MANNSFWDNFINYFLRPSTDFLSMGLSEIGWHQRDQKKAQEEQQIQQILNNAQNDPIAAQGQLAQSGLSLSADQEKWLDNLISQSNTQSARDWEEYQASTDLLKAGEQLQKLGLSNSGVLSTGGSSVNPVGAAANVKTNIAMQRYQMQMSLAKQLLSMTSSMASAGVYGSALGAARKASALLASQTAHSARMVTRYDSNDNRVGRTISELLPDDFDYSSLF